MQESKDKIAHVYRIKRAASPRPVIYDSPHSGRIYPPDFAYSCDPGLLHRAEDNHVDELLSNSPAHGIHLLCAEFPRTYIDVNRAADDIDPAQICDNDESLPCNPTDKGRAGIGLIRRDIKPGIPVYRERPRSADIRHRIDNYYVPYHQALTALLEETHNKHQEVWHINWHSMPSLGAVAPLPRQGRRPISHQPDFVLGDRHGSSCWPIFTKEIKEFLSNLGYLVYINNPYKGAEIIRRHSNPLHGKFSLQIEINKGLYWDERKLEKNNNFSALQDDIDKLSRFLVSRTTAPQT